MKKICYYAALAAMVAFTACTKEIPSENAEPAEAAQEEVQPGYVQMSFSAAMDSDLTKAYLSGTSVLWAGDESIAVFDHDAGGAANKFDIHGSGAAASFTGTVPVGATSFTAVYPYSDAITYVAGDGSPVRTVIPAVQEATLNSFDPAAAVFVATATSSDAALTFTPAFSLFKVNVDVDNVVQVSVSTTTNNLAGSVKVSRSGGLGNGDGDLSKTIVLKKSDDSVLAQGEYYIVTRFPASGKSFANFTLKYVTSDAKTNSRVSVDGIADTQFARKDILNLGSLSAMPGSAYTSWYEYYQLGYDIKIGSKTINKATNGDATLWTADNAVTVLNKSSLEAGGVYFLKTVGTGSFKNENNPTITNSTYLLSDSNLPAEVNMTNTFNLAEGALYLKGLQLAITGKSYFFAVNKNTSDSMSEFIMDDCIVNQNVASFISTHSSYPSYGVKRVEMVNNKFVVGTAANIVNITNSYTGISVYKVFVFDNNYVYGTAATNYKTSIFSYSGSTAVADMEVEISNNLFYNAANSGIFKHQTIGKATAVKNVIWVADDTAFNANGKLFGIKTALEASNVNVTDNVAYGTLAPKSDSTPTKWVIADSTPSAGMTPIEVPDSSPIASADTATGTFVMAAGYEDYGPQGI